ncbi:MAG: nucleotide exchange factor GrpE [Trueperella sp.]|nr:nucleotide exchange factor GrpE [Trueperella sp.]
MADIDPEDTAQPVPGDGEPEAAAEPDAVEPDAVEPEAVELSELDKALLQVAQLEEDLARRNADLYNLRQEYNGYVKRSKADGIAQRDAGIAKVLDTLLTVLDDAALAREHGDLVGPAGTIVEKLESTLGTNFRLHRFGAAGEEFDPQLHDALMHSTSAEVEKEQIAQLIQPGYMYGDRVLRPARVAVVSPE